MDGWCSGIIFNELVYVYRRLKEGKPIDTPAVVPYSKYIRWLEEQDKEEGLNYWEQYLDGVTEPTTLPISKHPGAPSEVNYRSEEVSWLLDDKDSTQLNTIARKNQVTLNSVFQAIWGIVLQRYNNCDDVVFGNVVSGRSMEIDGIDRMIGLFINTVPTRIITGEHDSFIDLIKKIHHGEVLSKQYEFLPLADIQNTSPLKSGIFNHILVFENYPI